MTNAVIKDINGTPRSIEVLLTKGDVHKASDLQGYGVPLTEQWWRRHQDNMLEQALATGGIPTQQISVDPREKGPKDVKMEKRTVTFAGFADDSVIKGLGPNPTTLGELRRALEDADEWREISKDAAHFCNQLGWDTGMSPHGFLAELYAAANEGESQAGNYLKDFVSDLAYIYRPYVDAYAVERFGCTSTHIRAKKAARRILPPEGPCTCISIKMWLVKGPDGKWTTEVVRNAPPRPEAIIHDRPAMDAKGIGDDPVPYPSSEETP